MKEKLKKELENLDWDRYLAMLVAIVFMVMGYVTIIYTLGLVPSIGIGLLIVGLGIQIYLKD